MDRDGDFKLAIEMATAAGPAKQAKRINSAGERGDWRADAWLLKHSPRSRDEWAEPSTGVNGAEARADRRNKPNKHYAETHIRAK